MSPFSPFQTDERKNRERRISPPLSSSSAYSTDLFEPIRYNSRSFFRSIRTVLHSTRRLPSSCSAYSTSNLPSYRNSRSEIRKNYSRKNPYSRNFARSESNLPNYRNSRSGTRRNYSYYNSRSSTSKRSKGLLAKRTNYNRRNYNRTTNSKGNCSTNSHSRYYGYNRIRCSNRYYTYCTYRYQSFSCI